MRVRLKADGRLVEIMADGSERAIAAPGVPSMMPQESQAAMRGACARPPA